MTLLRQLNRLNVLLLMTGLIFSFFSHGHEYTPAYLSLTEQGEGQFRVKWKTDTMAELNQRLQPQFPGHCQVSGTKKTYQQGESQLQFYQLNCTQPSQTSDNNAFNIHIKGLLGSKTDALVNVSYLSGAEFTYRLTPNSPSVTLSSEQGSFDVITTYTLLGVEHILIGLDHLLFVLALVLLIRSFGQLIKTITAFTLAHSLTLAATSLGWFQVASEPVEATIAISILFLALQLVKTYGGNTLTPPNDLTSKYPWLVAFSFGLLHGFGFAGALADIGLPEHAIPLALLFFNVGVELGQVLFVLGILALGRFIHLLKLPYPKKWKVVIAYLIGSLSVFWVIERSTWLVG